MRRAERSCRARGSNSLFTSVFGARESQSKNMASSDRASHGFEYKALCDAAQLAPEDILARVHDSFERNSFGHKWWPGWRPVPETNVEKLPPEPRRHRRGVYSSTTANHCQRQIVSMS